jgi:predicted kinase
VGLPRREGRLVVLCGLPGSGKSTVAGPLARELGAVRLNADEWLDGLGFDLYDEPARARVEGLQQRLALELLTLGNTVIYESGGWTRVERDALRAAARAVGAAVELRYLDVPVETLWERLDARNSALPPASVVIERDDLLRWAAGFERPDAGEQRQYDEPR